ncbi:MAG: signal peptidase II [Anaerovoracaceae bacterium]
MYWGIAAAVIIVDQISKSWIRGTMALGESVSLAGNYLHLTYVHNYGAAFSILQNRQTLLVALPLLITAAITGYVVKRGSTLSTAEVVALSLIAGGGLGNLVDRIRFGYVVDFINIRILPVFNVADMAVCAGSALLVYCVAVLEARSAKSDLS